MQSLIDKAKAIRLLILDVDGILTSGTIFYGNNNIEVKGFHVHDGLGMKLLQKAGIVIAVISARKSDAVARRLKDLEVKHVYLGHHNKLSIYNELKQKLNLTDDQIAYMGDDLPDLLVMQQVALAMTVPQAPEIMKQHADLITKKKAGKGAVREACEFILQAQDCYQTVIQSYLHQ